jgi:ABC-type antimicrobial peptide transport system permease subunit
MAFAGVAMVTAGVGLYGVVTYSVAQRTRDIGIRIALGSTTTRLIVWVLRDSAAAVGIGMSAGIAGAILLLRLGQTMSYDVPSPDLPSIALGAAVTVVAATLAYMFPMSLALRVDPLISVRAGES